MNTIPPNGIQFYKRCHYPFSFSTFFPASFTTSTTKFVINEDDSMLATASFTIQFHFNPRAIAQKFIHICTPLCALQVLVQFSMEVRDIPVLLETFLLIFCSLEKMTWEMLSLPVEQLAQTYRFRSTRSSLLQGICAVSCTNVTSCSTIANKLGHRI